MWGLLGGNEQFDGYFANENLGRPNPKHTHVVAKRARMRCCTVVA